MYTDTSVAAWRKSRFCNGASACVEVASLADGNVALRDSKAQDGPVLVFTPSEWAAFTAGVRDGEFDLTSLAATAS
ncbi:DUF397 domain-containing protein [Nonomuraea sp. NEAU-A123]|jgi:hypothetical protein|uniref:DUF397 domain-containing protein n=1 Tax=Nonomuraea sp. NEAU-A123 TaxID=2839649 RepID=UPI001BE4D341|nr:DUF397 domain-containing protein [Nonomuraea sp. NEAU-A123]MBT2225836.1 DUF397 domain-containing protein [Nonomuraea sp. NEAU-A123]